MTTQGSEYTAAAWLRDAQRGAASVSDKLAQSSDAARAEARALRAMADEAEASASVGCEWERWRELAEEADRVADRLDELSEQAYDEHAELSRRIVAIAERNAARELRYP